jgi:hypothetical protein
MLFYNGDARLSLNCYFRVSLAYNWNQLCNFEISGISESYTCILNSNPEHLSTETETKCYVSCGLFHYARSFYAGIYSRIVGWQTNMEKVLEASGRDPFETLTWNLPGGTEENDQMPQLG